jgi:hypothetical protein
MNLLMLSLVAFGGPKAVQIAPPAPAPPPPTIDQAMQSQQNSNLLRQRKGAAASILAGDQAQTPQTGPMAKLLGT